MSKKAVERMALLGAERIVYVSCNPTTLAANAAQLAGLGYGLRACRPVDMFPHTHHVETVALVRAASRTGERRPITARRRSPPRRSSAATPGRR